VAWFRCQSPTHRAQRREERAFFAAQGTYLISYPQPETFERILALGRMPCEFPEENAWQCVSDASAYARPGIPLSTREMKFGQEKNEDAKGKSVLVAGRMEFMTV
jgi:hypothetical protein